MVKKFFYFLHSEISDVHRAAYLLGFFAICSQVLALFRDRILAAHFGATNTLDFYYAAFRIPDFLFITAASIVSISVLIPFLMESLDKSREDGKIFVDSVFTFFFALMMSLGILAYIFTPSIMRLLFPVFAKLTSFGDLVRLSRLLLLSPAFLGFSNLLASITQTNKRFFIYATSPILYNLGIIAGIIFLYPRFGLFGLGLGVIIGAFLHFAIQIPFIASVGLVPKFRKPPLGFIKKIIFTSLPRTIAVSSNEIAELFLISFASFLSAGSISIFNFSFNLQSVPFSVIGVSYSLATFPTLTKLFSSGNREEFLEHMISSGKHIIFWSVPITTMFIVLRAQIVRVILGSGRFNWEDTRLTAAALALFTLSLTAQNLVALFVRSYYSQGRTKTPLYMNMISAALIVFGSFGLIKLFNHNLFFQNFMESLLKVSSVHGTAVLMLPLGFSIGLLFNLVVHWVGFQRHFPSFSKALGKTIFQVVSSSVIMGYVIHISLGIFDKMFDVNTFIGIFLQGFVSGIIGILSGVIVLKLLGSDELGLVWGTLHKKIWRAKVIGPDAELQ